MTRRILLSTATALLVATTPGALAAMQQQKPTPPAAPAPAPPGAAQPAEPSAEAYSYNPEGRRDPFVSLLLRGDDLRAPGTRPEGLAGLMIGDVTVRGIVRSRRGFVAMLQAPDGKTHIVHASDRLFDGSIKSITADGVVFLQEVNDPLSLIKQREVRKSLRMIEEGA